MGKRENRAGDPFDLPQKPTLSDILRTVGRNLRLSIRTHVPAAIKTYDAATRRATVIVQHLQVIKVVEPTKIPTGIVALKGTPPNADATMQPIELRSIPVVFPRTSSGEVTFPIVPGDTGELHVSDRSLQAWLQTGIPSDPVLSFTHALQDSVFHPGLYPVTAGVQPSDMTATVLDGTTQVKLGKNAVESVTKAESLLTALIQAVTAAPVGSMDGGATFKAGLITQLSAIVASQIGSVKVKVE